MPSPNQRDFPPFTIFSFVFESTFSFGSCIWQSKGPGFCHSHGTTTTSATFCTFNAKQGLLKWAALS
jgi:hypothetical protein